MGMRDAEAVDEAARVDHDAVEQGRGATQQGEGRIP